MGFYFFRFCGIAPRARFWDSAESRADSAQIVESLVDLSLVRERDSTFGKSQK